jgi:hypothetical protein
MEITTQPLAKRLSSIRKKSALHMLTAHEGRHLLFAESEPVITSIRGDFFVRHSGDAPALTTIPKQADPKRDSERGRGELEWVL